MNGSVDEKSEIFYNLIDINAKGYFNKDDLIQIIEDEINC